MPHHHSTFHTDPTMRDLLVAFTRRLPAQVAQLRSLIAQNNPGEIRRIAHQLKGAGKSYGFPPITEHAAAIEQKLSASPASLPAAQPDLHALISYIENIEGYHG